MIRKFSGHYSFLSNFYPCIIKHEGIVYPSVENAYQASKSVDPEVRKQFTALSAGHAKKLGQRVKKREDWEDVKIEIMRDLLIKKFSQPKLRTFLLMTENDDLIEGNTWGDTFWGVYRGKGENWLGKLLMEVRDEIRQSSPQEVY